MYRHYLCYATSGAGEIFKSLNTPLGRHAAGLLERGDFAAVLQLSVDALTYESADEFRDDYFVTEHLSKFLNFDVGIDRVAVALDKFRKSEQDCLLANHRLKSSYGTASTTVSAASLIYTAQRKIARLLGPFSWDEAEQHFGFGPGSTTSLKRTHGDAYYKFGASKPHVTKECLALGFAAVRRIPRWFSHLAGFSGELSDASYEELSSGVNPYDIFTVVPGNEVITVPKNAKTDRVIAKEPDLNMYCQKGIGGIIRSRLKRVGIDLNDQTTNQDLACEGSETGLLATLDLSAASDTVALQLCYELMPPDWMSAIETCRSHSGVLPTGEVLTYQKVSSMGNGFTFELESLIFWALVHSVLDYSPTIERRVAVYGDDLIFSSDIYEPVVDLLSFCGFTVNAKKSFHTGKFRESCGSHFFAGRDVTPFYCREAVDSTERLIWYANSIRRWARKGSTWGLDARLQACHSQVVEMLPKFWRRPRIPEHLGNIALIGDFDEVRPKKALRGYQGWQCLGVGRKLNTFLPCDGPILLKSLYGLEKKKGPGDDIPFGVPTPSRAVVWRVVRPVAEQWESFGPWL